MPKAVHYTPAAIRGALDKKEIEPAVLDEMCGGNCAQLLH